MVGEGCQIRDSILMGADDYETEKMKAANRLKKIPDIGIGKNCRIKGAIIDKNARIGDEVVIERFSEDCDLDGARYVIRDGIVVVPRKGTIPSGTIISPKAPENSTAPRTAFA